MLIILPLAGLLLHSGVATQRDVQAVADAGTASQVAADSVEEGVRYAGSVHLDPWSSTHPDERLVVTTRLGTAGEFTAMCQSWFYDSAAEILYTKRVPVDAQAKGAVAEPITRDDLATWRVLAEGVTRRPVDPANLEGSVRPIFTSSTTPTASTVTIDLRIPTSPRRAGQPVTSREAVILSTSVTTRAVGTIAGHPCH